MINKSDWGLKEIKKRKGKHMIYITERIVNLKDFENKLEELHIKLQLGQIDESIDLVKQLQNFEFEIEKRKVSYCE